MTAPLGPGVYPVPPGHCTTVVTYLEMTARPPARPADPPAGTHLRRVGEPALDWYRDMFMRVGGREWLWSSRMHMDDATLSAVIHHPDQWVFALALDGRDEGLLELDFRTKGDCELAFFGLTRALIGTTAGRWLMNQAIELAWSRPIARMHVHTCTLDHPAALSFYRRSGFVPLRQEVEIVPDPRLTGFYPPDSGPHIPIFAPDRTGPQASGSSQIVT